MHEKNNNIRPSALPKLALCGQFESAPGTSDAAARGSRIDALFRGMWETGEIPKDAARDEIDVAYWAVNQLARLGTNGTVTCEKTCKVYIPICEKIGTMDAVNLEHEWLADLKTGQMHGYKEQMAAYALGCMKLMMSTEWTAHLIFADQKEIVTHKFTLQEAEKIVQDAVNNVGTTPNPNDYCQWCAKSLTCAPRLESQRLALATTEAPSFATVLADPDLLGEFLNRAKVFDDFREAAKDRARELLEAGVRVPGWRLQKPRVTELLDAAAQLGSGIPFDKLIMAHGPISAKKARELGTIDESLVIRKESRPILAQL
jgi:hypothetical protein